MALLRSPRALVVLLLLLGAALTLVNRPLPLVRNSLVYARVSERIIEHGWDPRPVVADSRLSYDKPILYSWLSAPAVRWLGTHDGLRLVSWLGTAAYLLAVLWLAREFAVGDGAGSLVWLAAAGPCVFYQFWSAHPDGWFAAIVVTCQAITQRVVARPQTAGPRHALLLGLVLYVGILFKNYALVLCLSCPLYLLWHLRTLRRLCPRFVPLLVTALAVFAVIGELVWLAWSGGHPLSRLEGEGGGVGQYAAGSLWASTKGTWIQLGVAVLLQFHVALVLLLRRAAWCRDLVAPLVCFGGVYLAGLMPFPTTFYNMRYFLPLFPLVALVLVRGLASVRPATRRIVLWAHAALAVPLIAVFNLAPVHRVAEPLIPVIEMPFGGVRLSLLDNLRMQIHREQKATLDHINANVPPGSTLYVLGGYYGDAHQGVFEHAGLIRPDITTRYPRGSRFEPRERPFFVFVWTLGTPRAPNLARLGTVADLGHALYRVN